MITTPPFERLLEAILTDLETIDYQADTGIVGVGTRHLRNRSTAAEERPCVAVRFDGDERADDDRNHNGQEAVRWLHFALVADLDLDTEDAGTDDTGQKKLGLLLAASVKGLRRAGSAIGALSDWIIPGAFDPDENSQPDEGRLVLSLTVVYRVRTDDENALLAQGEMG